jgi:hypothetical protein
VVHTAGGDLIEHAPILYQEGAVSKQAVSGRYVLRGQDRAGFHVDAYGGNRPLVIDPVLSSGLPRAWGCFHWARVGGLQPHLSQFRFVELDAYVSQTATDRRVQAVTGVCKWQ